MEEIIQQIDFPELFMEVRKVDETYMYDVPLNQTRIRDYHVLNYLQYEHACFTPIKYEITTGICRVTFEKTWEYMTWQEMITSKTWEEKLQYCIATHSFEKLSTSACTGYFHPQNIFISKYGGVQLFYRGILHQLPPATQSPQSILQNRKALVIHTLYPKWAFEQLATGVCLLSKLPEDAQHIFASRTHAELSSLLEGLHARSAEHSPFNKVIIEYCGYLLCLCTLAWFIYFNILRKS